MKRVWLWGWVGIATWLSLTVTLFAGENATLGHDLDAGPGNLGADSERLRPQQAPASAHQPDAISRKLHKEGHLTEPATEAAETVGDPHRFLFEPPWEYDR